MSAQLINPAEEETAFDHTNVDTCSTAVYIHTMLYSLCVDKVNKLLNSNYNIEMKVYSLATFLLINFNILRDISHKK